MIPLLTTLLKSYIAIYMTKNMKKLNMSLKIKVINMQMNKNNLTKALVITYSLLAILGIICLNKLL